jgi:DNA-binding response OmpR family regulator
VRLRRKLGDIGQRIEAVWGVGYRFRLEASI